MEIIFKNPPRIVPRLSYSVGYFISFFFLSVVITRNLLNAYNVFIFRVKFSLPYVGRLDDRDCTCNPRKQLITQSKQLITIAIINDWGQSPDKSDKFYPPLYPSFQVLKNVLSGFLFLTVQASGFYFSTLLEKFHRFYHFYYYFIFLKNLPRHKSLKELKVSFDLRLIIQIIIIQIKTYLKWRNGSNNSLPSRLSSVQATRRIPKNPEEEGERMGLNSDEWITESEVVKLKLIAFQCRNACFS